MIEGTVVRADSVKIHENVIETGRDESHDRDEPSRSAGCAWGHAEPFIESVGGATDAARFLLNTYEGARLR